MKGRRHVTFLDPSSGFFLGYHAAPRSPRKRTPAQGGGPIIRIFLKNEAPKALYSSHWFIVSALKINHPPKYQSPYTRSPYHHASHPLLSVISPVVGISVIKLSGVLHLHRPHTTIPPIVPYFSAIVVATAPIPSTATAASAASIAFIICGDH